MTRLASILAALSLAIGARGASVTLTSIGGGGGGGGSGVTKGNYAGVAPPVDGSVPTYLAFDTSTGFLWYNSGTIVAPTWNNV